MKMTEKSNTQPSLWDFRDYKAYLGALVGAPGARKGLKTKIARAIDCQSTYVSQVLHRSAHLSLEQTERLAQFLGLGEEESHYLLLLVQKERAGTRSLKEIFRRQVSQMQSKRQVTTHRLGIKDSLSIEDQATYYSSWQYSAVHIAVTVPGLDTAEKISAYLGLSLTPTLGVLRFLTEAGLVVHEMGSYRVGQMKTMLSSDSPNLPRHHTNWRMRAIASLDSCNKQDLHYSAVISASREDVAKLRDQIFELLKAQRELIAASPAEELFGYTIDLFQLN